ncbi:hypothetical protein DFH09DRAFT_1083368 [Mycena vulgaris]|nr:hypothetical protein DFH09DRAFT_1083368 [Mycena vulgaris]
MEAGGVSLGIEGASGLPAPAFMDTFAARRIGLINVRINLNIHHRTRIGAASPWAMQRQRSGSTVFYCIRQFAQKPFEPSDGFFAVRNLMVTAGFKTIGRYKHGILSAKSPSEKRSGGQGLDATTNKGNSP